MSITQQQLAPAPYVTIRVAAMLTGYSEKAIELKIDEGKWLEGEVWIKAPDGRRLISMRGFAKWVEGQGPTSK